jgi:glycerol-3-phosphate dehydrogenase
MKREAIIATVQQNAQPWDVVVIGGGATGLGAALEAVTRGCRTLLLEQTDFAKSTSSKSTKLVHGGVRYLGEGDVGLVREASIERGRLLKNAPHLVRNLSFVIPIFSWWESLKYTIGLKLYDRLAGRLSLGRSQHISKRETLQRLSTLAPDGLSGGVLYHDGQFDDSRLAINLAQTIREKGGTVLNYVRVTALCKDAKGRVTGIRALDTIGGMPLQVDARAVINATGVFTDDILQLDKPGARKSIVASQGVHLVLDASFLPGHNALMIPKTSDGRVLFIVPWHDKVVAGTTDTLVNYITLEPHALEQEIGFILNTAGQYLQRPPERKDVRSVWAGLRPLAAPEEDGQKTKEISRNHKIMVAPSGLVTIIGGKWTTYRRMAEDVLRQLEKANGWPATASVTQDMPLHGAGPTDWNDPWYYYGSDAVAIRNMIVEQPALQEILSASLHIRKAQVVWAVHHEMACHVEDFLARRTRALFLDAREALRIAPVVASIMAWELQQDSSWEQRQLESFTALAKSYLLS